MIKKTRAQRGLGKYDAPLRVQHQMGYDAFKHGRVVNPFNDDTMQYREWYRGFNKAFYDNLKRVKQHEARARSTTIPQGEV
jgi:hypothetical protein